MKKFMLIAASAAIVLAAGCAKNERLTSSNDEPHAIGFTNYTPKSITKANSTLVTAGTPATGTHFAVYGWQTNYNSFLPVAPGTPNFMNPANVAWGGDTSTGSGNAYTPQQYWPTGDTPANLSFVAYYPYNGAGITAPTWSGSVGTYVFTAQDAPASMIDFCVSDVVNDQVYSHTNKSESGADYYGTVQFTFHHALTKVQFMFKKASTGLANTTVIELVEAQLSGIKNTGTLTNTYAQNASPAVNALGTTSRAWSSVSGDATYDITLNRVNPKVAGLDPVEDPEVKVVLGSEAAKVDGTNDIHNDDIFLMVPQDMAAATQLLTITWKVKVYDSEANATANNGTGLVSTTTNTKTLSLYSDLMTSATDDTPLGSHINWGINDFITYTITIGPKPILFTATVANWNPEQQAYINVH